MRRIEFRVKLLLSVALLLQAELACSQINLVLNPSFEIYDSCPNFIEQLTYAKNWTTLDSGWRAPDWTHDKGGGPEFCHTCATSMLVSVPHSNYYNHYPHAGNGMIQLEFLVDQSDSTIDSRDHAQGKLASRLIAGRTYGISFFTTTCQNSSYAINNIGAYLDDGTIDTTHHPGWTQFQYTPQVVETTVINDTLNWHKVEGMFVANGTEKFITISNFARQSANTLVPRVTIVGTGNPTWYLIDDVGVIDCDNVPFAGRDTLIRPGDSAFLGSHEGLLPYTWYKLGSTTAIDSGGGIWVKPTVTTTYVLRQDLCKVVKWDTIKVRVWPDTVKIDGIAALQGGRLRIYPNPAVQSLTIEGAKGFLVSVFDVVGNCVVAPTVAGDKELVNIGSLARGIYFVRFADSVTGEMVVREVVRE